MIQNKLRERLKLDFVRFKYKKKDGNIRHAFGTNNPKYLYKFFNVVLDSDGKQKASDDLITYYDCDKKGWRCLRSDNLIDILV